MLIVSRFKDYYDVGMKMGVDKTCVFVRDTVEIKEGFLKPFRYSPSGFSAQVIGFCGKFYPFVVFFRDYKPDEFIWTKEEAIKRLNPQKSKRRFYWGDYRLETAEGLNEFFEAKFPEMENVFHEHRTAVFGFTPARKNYWGTQELHNGLTVNPCLKDIEFFKVKDPITTFQEIAMYMSGVIGAPPKELVEISDKDMAASKGHDGEFSFKKPPGKRSKNGRWR